MAILQSGLSDTISDDEDIARFLTQSSHFNASMAKPSAFMPSVEGRETSVSRHGPEPVESLWAIGTTAAGARPLYGAALVKARDVREAKVEAVPDEPPPRHAAIRGWPWLDDIELQRAKQKEIAISIASKSMLLLR